MGSIWTEENEDRNIVKVEVTACEAMNKLGIVPDDALHDIQTKADFDLDRSMKSKRPPTMTSFLCLLLWLNTSAMLPNISIKPDLQRREGYGHGAHDETFSGNPDPGRKGTP